MAVRPVGRQWLRRSRVMTDEQVDVGGVPWRQVERRDFLSELGIALGYGHAAGCKTSRSIAERLFVHVQRSQLIWMRS